MKIAICDDELTSLQGLSLWLKNYASERNRPNEISCFSTGSELLEAMRSGESFSVIFMDIELDGENGVDIARTIRTETSRDIFIIFESGYPSYSIESIEVHPFRFLVKPINFEKLCETMDSVYRELELTVTPVILLKLSGESIVINVRDILYIDTVGNLKNKGKIIYHTSKDKIPTSGTLSEAEEQLSHFGFIRCHRSYLVNPRNIYKCIGKNIFTSFIMNDNVTVPIGRKYREKVHDQYFDYIRDCYF